MEGLTFSLLKTKKRVPVAYKWNCPKVSAEEGGTEAKSLHPAQETQAERISFLLVASGTYLSSSNRATLTIKMFYSNI